jgi:hypothetical protein
MGRADREPKVACAVGFHADCDIRRPLCAERMHGFASIRRFRGAKTGTAIALYDPNSVAKTRTKIGRTRENDGTQITFE